MTERYAIRLLSSAEEDIEKLPESARKIVYSGIALLEENPKQGEMLKGKFRGVWRLRKGKCRILYRILHTEIVLLVLKVGHRKDIYRGLL